MEPESVRDTWTRSPCLEQFVRKRKRGTGGTTNIDVNLNPPSKEGVEVVDVWRRTTFTS